MNKLYTAVLSSVLMVSLLASGCDNASASDDSAQTKSETPASEPPPSQNSAKEAGYPEAVVSHDGEQVKQSIEHLFEIVESGDNSPAAQFIAYRGEDKSREWKDGYNYEEESERLATDKVCLQLQALKRGLDHYEFVEFFKEKESEGEWNVWEMKFHYEDGSQEDVVLAFLRIRSHYLLGDID